LVVAATECAGNADEDFRALVRRKWIAHRLLRRVDRATRFFPAALYDTPDDVAGVGGADLEPVAGLDPLAVDEQFPLRRGDSHIASLVRGLPAWRSRTSDTRAAVTSRSPTRSSATVRFDIVFARGFAGELLSMWEYPYLVWFIEQLETFSRVIMLDKRGTGLSDRVRVVPTLETRMDDLRAVMDA